MKKCKTPHFHGHRQRLRQKFIESNSTSSFPDYELIELLLFQVIPRRDVKPLAKHLLTIFGSLSELTYTDKDKFLSIEGTTESMYLQLSIIKEIIHRIMQSKVIKKNILSSWNTLIEYLKTTLGDIKIEQFRILFLNKKNMLIADEIQTKGTIDQTPLYPREVVKKALFHEATAIIMVHNHPSGNSDPSKADIHLTQKMLLACESMNIILHDHVIICKDNFYSFKSNGLL